MLTKNPDMHGTLKIQISGIFYAFLGILYLGTMQTLERSLRQSVNYTPTVKA